MAFVLIALAGGIGFVLRYRGWRAGAAILLGAMIVPVAVLFAEFALPYSGGGASMWPVAVVVGAAYGGTASAAGVVIAGLARRYTSLPTSSP